MLSGADGALCHPLTALRRRAPANVRTSQRLRPAIRPDPTPLTADPLIEEHEITLHGNAISYRRGGRGPKLVLLHGIASNNHTWDAVIGSLATTHDVIAPDLVGHGLSAKPMGDYSIGGYATVIRDLLLALDAQRVTLVGHSLGGGIAMQLLHMAPELVGRLVLVSSGGLGRDLGAVLRAASLPGAPLVIRAATSAPAQLAGRAAKGLLDIVGVELPTDATEGLDGFASLHDPDAREAFLNTVRASTGLGGQRVSAVDKLYLMRGCPLLTIWGARDAIIPVQHAYEVQALVPDMHLRIIEQAGHFPHVDAPREFGDFLRAFEAATTPSELTLESLAEILREETDEPELTGTA